MRSYKPYISCSEKYSRVAKVREKYLEIDFFSRSGKSQVREFENKWLWQTDFRKFIFLFKR